MTFPSFSSIDDALLNIETAAISTIWSLFPDLESTLPKSLSEDDLLSWVSSSKSVKKGLRLDRTTWEFKSKRSPEPSKKRVEEPHALLEALRFLTTAGRIRGFLDSHPLRIADLASALVAALEFIAQAPHPAVVGLGWAQMAGKAALDEYHKDDLADEATERPGQWEGTDAHLKTLGEAARKRGQSARSYFDWLARMNPTYSALKKTGGTLYRRYKRAGGTPFTWGNGEGEPPAD